MDILNIGVTTDASAAADGLTKVSASIDKVQTATEKMNVANVNATRLIAQNEAESRKFIAALQEEINSYGKGREAVLSYRASQLGVANEAKALIDQLKQVQGGEIKNAGKEMEQFGFHTAGAKRELLVLAHELSQGNYKRFAGSMMVLGERTNAMGLIFSSAGLMIGATAAALVGFVAAAVKGAIEAENFKNSMKITGDYAGITASQFDHLATKISGISGEKVGNAREALQALVSTGRFSGQALEALGTAAVRMEHLTGQSAEEIVKDFEKMSGGVAKWVKEHNESMHFATLAQYQHIQALEDAGKKEEAYLEVAKLLNNQSKLDVENLGFMQIAWRGLKSAVSDTVEAMKSVGREESNAEKIAQSRQHISFIKDQPIGEGAKLAAIKVEQEKIKSYLADEDKKRAELEKKSQSDIVQEKGIAAHERLNNKWREMAGSINLADREIQKFRSDYYAALAANPNDEDALDSQKNAAKIENGIRKHYNRADYKVENKANNAYDAELKSLGEVKAKLQDEIVQYEQFGKIVDKSSVAVLNFKIANEKLGNGTTGERSTGTLLNVASDADALAKQLSSIKVVAGIDAEIRAMHDKATAAAGVKEATLESILLGKLEHEKSMLSQTDYDARVASIHKETQALQARDAVAAIATMDRGASEEIAKIKEEADLIGKSILQQKELAAARKINNQLDKDIAVLPSQESALRAAAKKDVEDITASLKAADKEQKTWGRGSQTAMQNYVDAATNAAAQTNGLFSSAFKSMEDALANFLQKGKLDFKSFVGVIENGLAHIAAQKMIAAAIGNSSSGTGLAGLLGSLFGSSGVVTAGNGTVITTGNAIDFAGAGFANGGDPPVGVPSMVGERGPEIFVPKQSGTIIPNDKIGGGGTSVTYSPVIHIDSRSDQAQVHQLVTAAIQQGNSQLVEKLQRQKQLR